MTATDCLMLDASTPFSMSIIASFRCCTRRDAWTRP